METCFDLLPDDMLLLLMRCLKQDSYLICGLSEYINKIQCKYINNIMNGDYEEDTIFTELKFKSHDKYTIEIIHDDCHTKEVKYSDALSQTFSNLVDDNFFRILYTTLRDINKKLARAVYTLKDESSGFFMILKLNDKRYAYLRAFTSNNYDENYFGLYLYKDYKDLMLNLPKEIKLYLLVTNGHKSDIIKIDEILPNVISINNTPRDLFLQY